MIVKSLVVTLILNVAFISDVTGASYSNVYVQREVHPMEYYPYGSLHTSIANPKLSQIDSLPSIPGYVAPCGSPCVYPAQTIATVTPVNTNPNVITYNAPVPSVPGVVTPTKEVANGYEYSYFIYDEGTGDHKAQRELSDGSVVRGEYSFIQPDGYVREVQYVADDISGFNAVVKNFLPVAVEGKRIFEDKEHKESSPPCHDSKNESLKEESEDTSHKQPQKESEKKHHMKHQHSKEESEEQSKEKSKKDSREESEENSQKEKLNKQSKDSEDESKEKRPKESKKESEKSGDESEEKSEFEKSKEELKEKSSKESGVESREMHKKKSIKVSKESPDVDSEEKSEEKVSHGKHKEIPELLKPKQETLVPYNDILRCIEEAMRSYGVPSAMKQEHSPLTYIILNKPCYNTEIN